MNVRAAFLVKTNTPLEVDELELEEPRAGEVLVKMGAAGVCHSDWHVVTGDTKHPLPVVLGHEGAGVVEAVGPDGGDVKPGDHVVLNWAPSCGSCFYCSNGRPSLCSTFVGPLWAGTMLDGTTRWSRRGKPLYHFSGLACFAERFVCPHQCCIPVAREVPMEIAALIGCAVTTGVGAVLNTAKVRAGSSVAVFGAGGVGLSIVMGAKLAGASQILVVDRTEPKRDLALRAGATEVFVNRRDTVQLIRDATEGRGADYVFEAIGVPGVQEQCLEAVRPGGLLVLAGISPVGSSTNFPGAILARQEKAIMGCYYGTGDPKRDFSAYSQMYLNGTLPLNTLLSKAYPLDRINEAYREMLQGAVARNVICF